METNSTTGYGEVGNTRGIGLGPTKLEEDHRKSDPCKGKRRTINENDDDDDKNSYNEYQLAAAESLK